MEGDSIAVGQPEERDSGETTEYSIYLNGRIMVTESDFTNGPSTDFGTSATHTPVTTTTHNITGEKLYSDGTPVALTIVMENANKSYSFMKAGLTEGADARMFVIGSATISKNDKILHNTVTYRVDAVSERLFAGNKIFKTVLLFETS